MNTDPATLVESTLMNLSLILDGIIKRPSQILAIAATLLLGAAVALSAHETNQPPVQNTTSVQVLGTNQVVTATNLNTKVLTPTERRARLRAKLEEMRLKKRAILTTPQTTNGANVLEKSAAQAPPPQPAETNLPATRPAN